HLEGRGPRRGSAAMDNHSSVRGIRGRSKRDLSHHRDAAFPSQGSLTMRTVAALVLAIFLTGASGLWVERTAAHYHLTERRAHPRETWNVQTVQSLVNATVW